MTERENASGVKASMEEVQEGWHELKSRVGQLEAERRALEQENKSLRLLLERVIEHRQKSHGELVLLLSTLVSKLPIRDIGVIVSRLVEHNTNVNQVLAALAKGTADVALPQPAVVKTLDQTKRDLLAALKPVVDELLQLDTPLESEMLRSLLEQPERFFSPQMVRADRCFIKGLLPRERIVRQFGEAALACFNDLTTDPKLNPRPKADEIVLGFKPDFEARLQQQALPPDKRQELSALYQRVQRSKAATGQARQQRIAFHRLSFLIELLHYYEHENTEAPDVIFAQRLPALLEQLVLAGPTEAVDEKLIGQAEGLLSYIISPEYRHAVINNIGKGGGAGKTLKYVLRLRAETEAAADETIPEFIRHLMASGQQAPAPEALLPALRLLRPDTQRLVVKSIMRCDRIRKDQAEALGRALAANLDLKGLAEELKAQEVLPPEVERRMAWANIKDLLVRHSDAATVAAAIRDRLHAKYEADELRQSWITLTETDPMSFIKIFCQLPYRADGKTDPIARTILESYVTRLTHEKYAATYHKVANSLRSMFKARPDSSTLQNFLALVRWTSPEAANRLGADIGVPTPK